MFEGAWADGRRVRIHATREGLRIEGPDGDDRRPWASVSAVRVGLVDGGDGTIAVARITFDPGTPLDLTPRDAPAVVRAPDSLGAEHGPLVRIARMRMLAGIVVTAAGLGDEGDGAFSRATAPLPARPVDPNPRRLPRWAPPVLVVLSFVALVVVFDLAPAEASVALIVLYVHETGHAVAMRLGGMRVRGVLFIPLVGAGTLPEHSFPSRWHEVGVYLSGALTALPVTAAIAFLLHNGILDPELGRRALIWTLGVNLFNLVPVMPIDGGRVWNAVALELPGVLRGVVAFLPAAAAVALLPFANTLGRTLLVVFLAFSVLSTTALLKRAAQQRWIEVEGFDCTRLRAALREVNHALVGRARDDIDGGVPPARLGPRRAVLSLVGYAGVVLLLFATYRIVVAQFPGLLGGA